MHRHDSSAFIDRHLMCSSTDPMRIPPPPHESDQYFLPKATKESVVNAVITSGLEYRQHCASATNGQLGY